MTGWKFISILLLSLLLWISTTTAQRSSFGEACDETVKCNSSAWLTCRNGTCDCMKPDVMMYEYSLGKCASKAGERCKFIIQEFDNNDVFEVISCIQNSSCNAEGFCACDNTFYEDLNGICSQAPSFMESCDSQVKCSKNEGFQCVDGQCKCDESISTYYLNGESSAPQCVGLAGESCINSMCVDNATCSNGECTCDFGFYQDDKLCFKKVEPLGICTRDEQCMNITGSQLICLNGVCNCDPTYSRYGTSQSNSEGYEGGLVTQCLGLAGSPCLDRLCVPNAYCNFETEDHGSEPKNSGSCKCMGDYKQSKTGTCPSFYGGDCKQADTCDDGLACKETKCSCPFNDQQYDPPSAKCISKVDGPCNSSTLCVSNAQCIIFSTTPFEAGHCNCKNGFIKTPEGKCTPKFGQPCVSSADCDSVAALVCTDEICQCNDFAKYSEKQRKCLGLVGATCDLNLTKSEPQCVENSKCKRVHPRLQGVCTCPPGYNETSQYTCELANQVVKKVHVMKKNRQGQGQQQMPMMATLQAEE